jgi:hypothetical protein
MTRYDYAAHRACVKQLAYDRPSYVDTEFRHPPKINVQRAA